MYRSSASQGLKSTCGISGVDELASLLFSVNFRWSDVPSDCLQLGHAAAAAQPELDNATASKICNLIFSLTVGVATRLLW